MLRPVFWDLGHRVFRSTPSTFPVKFMGGDALFSLFWDKKLGTVHDPVVDKPPMDVSTLTSLQPIRGRLNVIHASSFIPLFCSWGHSRSSSEVFSVEDAASCLQSLLSPAPGSLIFGSHVARLKEDQASLSQRYPRAYRYNPESWRALWEGVFGTDKIDLQVEIENEATLGGEGLFMMTWSVKRL